MTIPDLKQLDKLVRLCRKWGIKTVKLGDMELILSDEAPTKPQKASQVTSSQQPSIFETDSLTEEQLLGWSVTDIPDLQKPGATEQ